MSLVNEAPKASYYETLQIPKGATDAEIKKAYRKLAMKWHPGLYRGRDSSRIKAA